MFSVLFPGGMELAYDAAHRLGRVFPHTWVGAPVRSQLNQKSQLKPEGTQNLRKLSLLLITAIAVLGTVGSASAAQLNWEGTNTIRVGDLAKAKLIGGGVATVNNSNGIIPAHLQTLRLAVSRGNITGSQTRFVTDPEAKGNAIASVQFLGVEVSTGTLGPISGVLGSTSTGGNFNGQLPVTGLVKLCILTTTCGLGFAGLPLTKLVGSQVVGVGIGGLLTFTISTPIVAIFSVEANPWSVKTQVVLDEQTTPVNMVKTIVPITFHGFAHDPASGTTGTAAVGGVVQLVAASQVKSTLPTGSNDFIASGQSLLVRFIPEPGMLLLIGSGAAGLALLGRKRMRK